MRRLRADQLTLVPADGTPITLFTETREPGEVTTQDIFQVSPDGAYLAYAAYGTLHLRAADGSERVLDGYAGLMRFSPDARYLAAYLSRDRLEVLDLAAGTARDLAMPPGAVSLEWQREALVVQTSDALIELPLSATRAPVTLLDHAIIDRFVAAGTGTRVVAFVREVDGTHVVAFDGGAHRDLGVAHASVTNAAESLDGRHVAYTTSEAVFTIDGDAPPQAIAQENYVHSLWFARDGRLGYASEAAATIGTQRFAEGPIHMLRFDPLSSQALVATSEKLGLDRFAGGYVVWNVR